MESLVGASQIYLAPVLGIWEETHWLEAMERTEFSFNSVDIYLGPSTRQSDPSLTTLLAEQQLTSIRLTGKDREFTERRKRGMWRAG